MKNLILLCLFLLPGINLNGQDIAIGNIGYRLVERISDADFNYKQLDTYFKQNKVFKDVTKMPMSFFNPTKDGGYTFYKFVGDLVVKEIDGVACYVPLANAKPNVLLLTANSGNTIVDGYFFIFNERINSSDYTLFKLRRIGLQLKNVLSLDRLHLRSLDNEIRSDAIGNLYIEPTILSTYKEETKPEDVVYNLVKCVKDADFDYKKFNNFDEVSEKLVLAGDTLLRIFEPIKGAYTYYQFLAQIIAPRFTFPEGGSLYMSDDELEDFIDEEFIEPLDLVNVLLILKTDSLGVIQDGYYRPMGAFESPFSGPLFRLGRKGVILRDGMNIQELDLEQRGYHGDNFVTKLEDEIGTIRLIPK